jgi:hypothetical protein
MRGAKRQHRAAGRPRDLQPTFPAGPSQAEPARPGRAAPDPARKDVTHPAVTHPQVPGATVHAAAMFTPHSATRSARRAAARDARRVEASARRAVLDAKRAQVGAERAERRAASYLPPGGEAGPDALRSYRRLALPPHRATSEVLGGAYPFLAEAGLGSDGLYIGADAWSGSSFCFDPWVLYERQVLTNLNMLLAGVIGKGKSALAKALATRSLAFGRKVYVPGDPKGEWTIVSRAVGGQAIELGGGLPTRLNPLDEGPRARRHSDADWLTTVRARRRDLVRSIAEVALGRDLHSVEVTALLAAIDSAVRENTTPTLPHVVQARFRPAAAVPGSTVEQLAGDGREVAHALNRLVSGDLGGLFDGPSTQRFDPSLPMVSLDLSRIQGSDQLIALVMTCASAWMEAALADSDGGQRWVIYDEAWRLVRQAALLARMQTHWKLSRAWGIANLMVIHRLSDLDAVGEANSAARNLALGLLADCSTKVIYAQESGEAGKTATALGLSSTEASELPGLARGEGLWRIKDRAFVVRHLCTPGELTLFDTDSRLTG